VSPDTLAACAVQFLQARRKMSRFLALVVAALLYGRSVRAQTEVNVIPVVGGDSDVGIGVGAVGNVAGLESSPERYRWKAELGSFISFKPGVGDDKIAIPFQDYYLALVYPRLGPEGRLRLEARPSFTDESTQRFYGVGNASSKTEGVAERLHQYGRRRVAATTSARYRFIGDLYVRGGLGFTSNWLRAGEDSSLSIQRANGSDAVRSLLDGPFRHTVVSGDVGLQYDTRDNEIVTRTGSFHSVRMLYSPRLSAAVPHGYEQLTSTARFYRSPLPWLVLRLRLLGDLLLGDPPFYELTRIEDMSVFGGGKGVRGVPGQRYYGMIKTFGNLEARAEVWRFSLFRKPFVLGTAAFLDGGRVWADRGSHPELDGSGPGLKYGFGGGLRLQEGQTFVVRFDVAWSPDARPIGAYFNVGEVF